MEPNHGAGKIPKANSEKHEEQILVVWIDYLKVKYIFLGELSLKSLVHVNLFVLSKNLNMASTSLKHGSLSNICLLTWIVCPLKTSESQTLESIWSIWGNLSKCSLKIPLPQGFWFNKYKVSLKICYRLYSEEGWFKTKQKKQRQTT